MKDTAPRSYADPNKPEADEEPRYEDSDKALSDPYVNPPAELWYSR